MVIGVGLNYAAYMSEVHRAGIGAVRIIVSPMASYAVSLLKDTAVASLISAPEFIDGVDAMQPITRIIDVNVYVRPDEGGLMLGGYEQTPLQYDARDLPARCPAFTRLPW